MKKVLVVDDEEVMCKMVKRALQLEGVLASFALSAEKAFDMLEREMFSLIVTDIKMPKMDGLTFMKIVKKDMPKIAILAMSGYGTDKMAKEVAINGAYEFLSKPFEINDLLKSVKSGLNWEKGREGARLPL